MKDSVFMWECECGKISYGAYPPRECTKCKAIESYTKVPDEFVEERELEDVLSRSREGEEEFGEEEYEG